MIRAQPEANRARPDSGRVLPEHIRRRTAYNHARLDRGRARPMYDPPSAVGDPLTTARGPRVTRNQLCAIRLRPRAF